MTSLKCNEDFSLPTTPTSTLSHSSSSNSLISFTLHKLMEHASDHSLPRSNSVSSLNNNTNHLNNGTCAIFNVKVPTLFGEEVFITGNCSALGDWDVNHAIKLTTDSNSFPLWSAVVFLNQHHSHPIEYKYFIRDVDGLQIQWEGFSDNRRLTTQNPMWVLIDDGVFGTAQINKNLHTTNNNPQSKYHIDATNLTLFNNEHAQKMELFEIQKQQSELKQTQQELRSAKQTITELEGTIKQLQKQITTLEGENLSRLSTDALKRLSVKTKAISDQAQQLMMRRLEEQLESMCTFQECVACMDNKIDTVLLPCGHLVVCHDCATKLNSKCPLCNKQINASYKVFMK